MKRCLILLFASIFVVIGCGSQNEYLSKGKEWVKSDKRGRIARAVEQFELAIQHEPENAEAHYLLGYYDENATIQRRSEQMVLAYKYNKKKYLKILIEEALRDRDENVRQSAVLALQTIHTQMEPITKHLIKTLKSKNSRDRANAALVLSKLSNYQEVVDRLSQKDVIEHKRMGTRFNAMIALGDIGDPRAIDTLVRRIKVLKTKDQKGEEPEVKRAAVMALQKIAKRDIDIDTSLSSLLNLKFDPTAEGVRVAQEVPGDISRKITLQKGEIITHVIDKKRIYSIDDFNMFVSASLSAGSSERSITFGLPKIVKVKASNMDELGITELSDKDGVVVEKLAIDSKAGKLGLSKGERISHVNSQEVRTKSDFERIVREVISKDEELKFVVANEDKLRYLTIVIPEGIDDIGMTVEPLPEGVAITQIKPQSPVIEAGLRIGDVISYVVDKQEVKTPESLRQLVEEGLKDGKVTISVKNQTAVSKLIEILRDKSLVVRFDAATALGQLKDKTAIDSLIEVLEEQANPVEIKL